MRIKSLTMVFFAALVLAAVGVAVSRSGIGNAVFAEPAVTAANSVASSRMLPRIVHANGTVEGRHPEVALGFEIQGRLASVAVTQGDYVRKGQLLAELDATVLEHAVDKAQAALERAEAAKLRVLDGATPQQRAYAAAEVAAAEARAMIAQRRHDRAQDLAAVDGIADQELDEAVGELRIAKASLAAAQAQLADRQAPPRPHETLAADAEIALQRAQLEHAQAVLARAELRTPRDGQILRIDAEPGELTGPQAEFPLITMVDTSELRVRAFVEEFDALRVEPGQRAMTTADGLAGRELAGVVLACFPSMHAKTYFSHRPEDRQDVKVREVIIRVDDAAATDALVVSLPVDVFIHAEPRNNCESNLPSPLQQPLAGSVPALPNQ